MREVGIVGSGALARAVSARLLEYGESVLVWGPDAAGVRECVAAGAATASTPAQVASRAQFIIIAATEGLESEKWLMGDHGVLQGMCDGRTVIDMTTISPGQAHNMGRACREAGGEYLDSPVSGGAQAARTGNMVMMVGGAEEAFDRALPVLKPLGRVIVRVGETGSGATAKLCNQVMCFVNLCGVCEGLALGAKAGIDLRKLFGLVTGGAAQSWELDNMGPMILARDFSAGYPVSASQYDLALVLDAARELKVFLPATSIVHQLYHAVETEGLASNGSQALIRALEKMSDVEVRG